MLLSKLMVYIPSSSLPPSLLPLSFLFFFFFFLPILFLHIYVDGKTEELVDKCISAASHFLYDLEEQQRRRRKEEGGKEGGKEVGKEGGKEGGREDPHYVSFITTENWGGEEEGGPVADEDGDVFEYEVAEDTR